MDTSQEKLQILEALVEELLKDRPREEIVASCMSAAGIKDSKDPIERINQVLRALHFQEKDKEIVE